MVFANASATRIVIYKVLLYRRLGDRGKGPRFAFVALNSGGMFPLGRGAVGVHREGVVGVWGPLSLQPELWGPRAARPPPPASGPGGAVTQ